MKKRIHINQHVIKSNKKNKQTKPPITVKTYKSNDYGNSVSIRDKDGNEVARVIYSPDKPLSCGATCWIETNEEVTVDA